MNIFIITLNFFLSNLFKIISFEYFEISKFLNCKIQMNLILFAAILKLLITGTVQNLIRFGDFQNLFPFSSEMTYAICGSYCNRIWYTASSSHRVELMFNLPPGKNKKTIAVDMMALTYIKLCQDLNNLEIKKTYEYTFDMYCNIYRNIQSCSVWVILNGQIINGSNHTNTDGIVHKTVGYINITSQNNTICFQSRQSPYFISYGTFLDNITLQIYTGKIPCNVLGCKLCVLNFPDLCQICQYMFRPERSSCKCQPKFYLNGNTCKICSFPCETCQGQARNCTSCQNLYRLQENQCVIANESTLALSMIASMPGIEFFSIGQIFLGILDQFWPYYSHHRVYGNQTIEILTLFHTVQNNKWFLLSLDKKIDFNFQSLNFSDYSAYSNQQFLKMESKTSYFWDGAFEIVFFSFPTMLIVFFVFNTIFYLTFKYQISSYFRPFSFLLMIYFLGIGEDISYLSFLSFSNGVNLFSFKFHDKLGHIVWIFVFFFLVLFCSGGYFVAKIFYKKLSKYFIEGFFPKLQSFHILGYLSMKQFMIGSANALLATNYETLIICLASIEVMYLIGVVYLQWKNRCYKIQTFVFLSMLKSILMTIFNISLWVDWKTRQSQQSVTEQQTNGLLDFNCKALLIAIIGLGVFQAISTYFSGRRMLDNRRKKQVLETKKPKRQVPIIINIKYTQFKQQISVKQQMRDQQNYFHQNNALEKVGKTSKSKKIKNKKALNRRQNVLSIIHEQDDQNEHQCIEIIVIKGWNDN